MLDALNPAHFVDPKVLENEFQCSECGCVKKMKEGVTCILHVTAPKGSDPEAVDPQGNRLQVVWLCSPTCILGFENIFYMGKA